KTAGVQFDFETGRYTRLNTSWTINDTRPVNCQNIGTRRGQILGGDLAPHSWRILCPIAHGGFACEHCVALGCRTNVSLETESGCDEDCATTRENSPATLHLRFQSLRNVRSRVGRC